MIRIPFIFVLPRVLVTISMSLLSLISEAQIQNRIKFDNFSEEKGFNNSSIVCEFQDNQGFLWFGTYGGLFRYDGNTFKQFQPIRNNPNSLVNGHVRSICQDTTGTLFIATINGLCIYNPETETFRQFFHNPHDSSSLSHNTIYKVFKDHTGTIWLGTFGGGLDKVVKTTTYTRNKKPVEHFRFIHYRAGSGKNQISSNKISDITETRDGNLWIGTQNGLNCFIRSKNYFKVYRHDPRDPESISNDNVSSVCVDKMGNIWAGTWEYGLNLFDPTQKRFLRFLNNPTDKNSISHNIIMKLFCDDSGNIWVGTWGGGLNFVSMPEFYGEKPVSELQGSDFKFTAYVNDKINPHSISGNSIYCILQDHTGTIWVGTDWNGLNKFHVHRDKFDRITTETGQPNSIVNNVIFSLYIDHQSDLWIGTQDGLNIMDSKTGKYSLFQHNPLNKNSLSYNEVRCITEDKKGNIWIGTTQGLNRFNRNTNTFKRFYENPERPGTTCIINIYQDSKGIFWLGTYEEGLLRFDPVAHTFKKYIHNPDDPESISNNIIWSICENQGKLLIGTETGGLCEFDPVSEKFKTHHPFDPDNKSLNTIYAVKKDHLNNIWLCTLGGLVKFKRDGKNNIQYELFSHVLTNGFIEDNKNNIWLLTNRGLGLFNQNDTTIKYFITDDQLHSQQLSINSITFDTIQGEVLLGGMQGYYRFDLRKEEEQSIAPVTKIIGLRIFNKEVGIGEKINKKTILTKSLLFADKLTLSFREYVIGFEYSALHFTSPELNEYAYMLVGFDKDWNYVGNQHMATYTNLPPGNYVFKVKASNPEGIWNDDAPTTLKLVIKPAWWETKIFKILFFLLVIGFALSVNRIRISILKGRQKILENMVSKRTEELSYANILLKEKQEEITQQNQELVKHRNDLEKLVDERTHELTMAKNKAEESDKLKSAFLANMSHEIRTPMNAIVGFSNLLDDDLLDPAEKEEYIRTIKHNSDSLLTIINDIVDISIIEANQLVLYQELFCVDEVYRELKSYYRLKNEKKLDFIFVNETLSQNTFIFNDAIRFRQIMTNLLNNAYKFTDIGSIKFGYQADGNTISFFVEDTGIGIDEDNLQKVFNDFHKIEPHANRFYQGTGIGLSISKRLVHLMGGEIFVASEVNKGSTFSFKLPFGDSGKVERKEINPAAEKKGPHDITIVIAEDEPDNFRLIEQLLKKTEAKIIWAHNGQEVVDYFQNIGNWEKHLILMDIKMPVLNGLEACKIIRQKNTDIPIIAVTAFAQIGDKDHIMKNGFDGYISKPLSAEKLGTAISQYIHS